MILRQPSASGREREEVVTAGKHGEGLEGQAVAAEPISVPSYCGQGSALPVILAIKYFSLGWDLRFFSSFQFS